MPVAGQPSPGQPSPSMDLPPLSSLNQQLLEGRVSAGSASHPPETTMSSNLAVRDYSALTSSKSECSTKEEEDNDCFEPTNGLLSGHGEIIQDPSVEQEHIVPASPGVVEESESFEVSSPTHISSADHSFPATAALVSPVTSSTSRLAQIKASLDTNRSDAESFLAMLNKNSGSSRTLSLSCSAGHAHTLISSPPLSVDQSSAVTDTTASSSSAPLTNILPITPVAPNRLFAVTDTTTSNYGTLSPTDALPLTPFAPDQSSAETNTTASSSGTPLTGHTLVTDLARLGMSTGQQLDADPQSSSGDITSSTMREHTRSSSSSSSAPDSYDHTPSPCPQDSHNHTQSSRSSSSFSINSRETQSKQEYTEESGGRRQAEFPSFAPTSSLGFSVDSQKVFALTQPRPFSEPLPFAPLARAQAVSVHSSLGPSTGPPIPSTNLVMHPPLYTAPLINGSTHLTSVATAGLTSPPANPLTSPVCVNVPERVVFGEVSCVGTVKHCQLTLSNPSSRWVQCNIKTSSLLKDGEQVCLLSYKNLCMCVCLSM